MATREIKTRIQLIRDFTVNLEKKNPQTLNGEFYICKVPNTEIEKFKIGNGELFNDIPYYEENLLKSLGIDVNNVTSGQILVYNGSSGAWENETFTDDNSITFGDKGLSIKGYDSATQGQMLTKDVNNGLVWTNPVTLTTLNEVIAHATEQATLAGNYATQAGSAASEASKSASQASAINSTTMEWVNNKFWWGTVDEYNNLENVTEGTFYFVRM